MRGMIGCAAMIASVAFVFGLIASVFATEANLAERLMIALMPAIMAFVPVLILFSRDYVGHTQTVRRVRAKLLARDDTSEDEFSRRFIDQTTKTNHMPRNPISNRPAKRRSRPFKYFDTLSKIRYGVAQRGMSVRMRFRDGCRDAPSGYTLYLRVAFRRLFAAFGNGYARVAGS